MRSGKFETSMEFSNTEFGNKDGNTRSGNTGSSKESKLTTFLSALIASAFLFGSIAFAEDGAPTNGKFESLEGKTQLGFSGSAGYSTYSQFSWSASGMGLHYLTPHFALGLSLEASGSGQLYYGIAPAFEYFVPVSDRGHLFVQGLVGVSGTDGRVDYYNSSSEKIYQAYAAAKIGYRYFLNENIALSALLMKSGYRDLSNGGAFRFDDSLRTLFGFSVFF